MLFQPAGAQEPLPPSESPPPSDVPLTEEEQAARRRLRELGESVELEALPDLGVIILRGNQRDVDEMVRVIEEIERLSKEAEPQVDVVQLSHVSSEALAPVLTQLEPDLIRARKGRARAVALAKPNAVLLIGWGDALVAMRNLVAQLDQPVGPETQLRIFRLRHAAATLAQTTLDKFFTNRTALGPKVIVLADVPSNSLIVHAAPRDMQEVEHLLAGLDTPRGEAVHELRVIHLKNSLAADLATVLDAAIRQRGAAAPGPADAQKSAVLRLLTIDPQGQRILESGILQDVRITPDPRTNTLVISAPAESIELLEALVARLDELPASIAQIKVFSIVNGDAAALVEMLRTLLGVSAIAAGGPQLAGALGEPSLAPLRFSVDTRTNSIIASGSAGDLSIVEAILLRLDDSDSQERKSTVYRLKNAPAVDVAVAINEFLRSERQVQLAAPGAISPFQQIESEVVVVPEPVSNSLIVSATPRYYDEIVRIVEDLDAQPPQVLIQVLIAEVALSNTDEFGVELGLQDSILFDRGLMGNLVTDAATTVGTQVIPSVATIPGGVNVPGFNFNNQPLGNSSSSQALARSANVGGQGLSHFSLGRINPDLGFGGLVLSASSESVSVLLRALRATRRIDVLARPQVMTLDNQPAFIQVGQRVPRVTATQVINNALINSIELENVGLIVGVTPRISPGGIVVMEIDAENSAIDKNPDSQIPIGVSLTGEALTSPSFNTTTAQTTVSAVDGQTIVLGGLIRKERTKIERRVPGLDKIPIVRNLFRYDREDMVRRELLIIMTPHVVRNEDDAQRLRQVESARMHWVLADIEQLHGECAMCERGNCIHGDLPTTIIYPDFDPRGTGLQAPVVEPVLPGPELLPESQPQP